MAKDQEIADDMADSYNTSSCVEVGGERYCGVNKTWTPRISRETGVVIMISNVALLFIMMLLVAKLRSRINHMNFRAVIMRNIYKKRVDLLNLKRRMRKGNLIELESGKVECTVVCYKRFDRFSINGFKTEHPQSTNSNEYEVNANQDELRAVENFSVKVLRGLVTLSKPCVKIMIILKLILLPMFAVLWDILDVMADTYYFYSLETGGLIDISITRNVRVNNSILVFAISGGLKLLVVTLFYSLLIESTGLQIGQLSILGSSISRISTMVSPIKILLEDGPELLLEYFFVDKFITANQPWFLVAKDIVTALIYALSLVITIQTYYEIYPRCMELRGREPIWCGKNIPSNCYTFPLTIGKVCMSIAMLSRVVGMIIQYTDGTIKKECFRVQDGELLQTPFSGQCLLLCDWIVLVFTGTSIAFSSIGVLIFIIFTHDGSGFRGFFSALCNCVSPFG